MKNRDLILLLVLLLFLFKGKKSDSDSQTIVEDSQDTNLVDEIIDVIDNATNDSEIVVGYNPNDSLFTTPDLVNDELTFEEIVNIRSQELYDPTRIKQ